MRKSPAVTSRPSVRFPTNIVNHWDFSIFVCRKSSSEAIVAAWADEDHSQTSAHKMYFTILIQLSVFTQYDYSLGRCLRRNTECGCRIIDKQFRIFRTACILLTVQRHHIRGRPYIQPERIVRTRQTVIKIIQLHLLVPP